MASNEMDSDVSNDNRSHLNQYYRGNNWNENAICDPFDMKSEDFNAELYLNKLLKESTLSQLMDKEQGLYKQIQSLDSEMQTLVYENYNKFISATETIRKMSSHFDKMEEELNLLSKNMDSITMFSEEISGNLRARRTDLSKLSSTHSVLKKLQFLFELSPKMRSHIEHNAYNDAVRYYLRAERALEQYRHFPSIQAIDDECKLLLEELKLKLHKQLANREASPNQLNESIELLLKLKEPPDNLCREYLSMSKQKLDTNLTEMEYECELIRQMTNNTSSDSSSFPIMDILEFIDMSCNGFLSNLSLIIVAYGDIFLHKLNNSDTTKENIIEPLKEFVTMRMNEFFEKIVTRIELEKRTVNDAIVFVRALDRFYRRLQTLNKTHPYTDFSIRGMEIIESVTEDYSKHFLENLKSRFLDELTNVRHSILSSITHESLSAKSSNQSDSIARHSLSDLLITLQTTISELIKSAVAGLTAFTEPEVLFVSRGQFQQKFSTNCVREGVVIGFLRYIIETASDYENSYSSSTSPPSQLILLLSRLCLDMDTSMIGYLLAFTDEQFNITTRSSALLSELCKESKEIAQKLLNRYVRLEGQNISQMIRKSVETRDWLSSVEPRSVRSVMRRVVEDISDIDAHVGQLYEEGTRFERSSDSSRSRRTFSAIGIGTRHQLNRSSNWSAYGSGSVDNNLMSNIQKLFSERIEIFGSIEFSKLSVVTGIIKIGLKTLIECVRLCTFSKFGLQQVQVDAYYLQTHVWAFVSDENLVYVLIDEVLTSTAHRCLDPELMEMSIVEKICDGL